MPRNRKILMVLRKKQKFLQHTSKTVQLSIDTHKVQRLYSGGLSSKGRYDAMDNVIVISKHVNLLWHLE